MKITLAALAIVTGLASGVLAAGEAATAASPAEEGPWRLVIPDEKRPVRLIRMIKRISVRAPVAEAPEAGTSKSGTPE